MRNLNLARTIAVALAVSLFAAGSVSADTDDTARTDDAAKKNAPQKEDVGDRAPDEVKRDGDPAPRPRGPRPSFGGHGRSGDYRRGPGGMPSSRPSMDRGGPPHDRDGRPGYDAKPGSSPHSRYGKGRPSGTPRWPHHNWESMKKADPEVYKLFVKDHALERKTRELGLQYRRAPEDQREDIRKQLVEAVDEHFEVRQQRRSLELKRLEAELQRLRAAIERRSKAKKDISARRIAELLGEDDLNF